jgi:Domain of unknown function (DUF4872)/Butirosin biosynthesis protein H, N-terminal
VKIDFDHHQSAHCESGVTSNLLRHRGLEISEALAFGLGSGLFFGYVPFVKLNHLPLITYRNAPGGIFRKVTRRLGVQIARQKFRQPQAARAAVDRLLDAGVPVGAQTGAYWLPYFPAALRFHFNMHNLVVVGREGDDYLISDPIFPEVLSCPAPDFEKARFARGTMAPKGKIYYVRDAPAQVDLAAAAKSAIRDVCRTMLKTPVPYAGIRGMRLLARHLEAWPEKLGAKAAGIHLGHMIRMQEEIGTGGGGFRFIYAAFLQELGERLQRPELLPLSAAMTASGDRWREFAVVGARLCKGRGREGESYAALAELLRDCAVREGALFRELLGAARTL